jgi:hypothetical protein
VITRGIRDFVARDWQAVRENKEAYWGDRISRLGAAEAFRVTEELRRQTLTLNPDWPDPAQRQADFESHLRVAALLVRADKKRR